MWYISITISIIISILHCHIHFANYGEVCTLSGLSGSLHKVDSMTTAEEDGVLWLKAPEQLLMSRNTKIFKSSLQPQHGDREPSCRSQSLCFICFVCFFLKYLLTEQCSYVMWTQCHLSDTRLIQDVKLIRSINKNRLERGRRDVMFLSSDVCRSFTTDFLWDTWDQVLSLLPSPPPPPCFSPSPPPSSSSSSLFSTFLTPSCVFKLQHAHTHTHWRRDKLLQLAVWCQRETKYTRGSDSCCSF